jgi:predicted TIM-barrel fold metal-dependent hydrolase
MTAPCAGPDPFLKSSRMVVPANATDTHFHILGPASRFPYIADREYTPPDALPASCRALFDTIGIQRAVIIQPSVYGTDNRCAMDAANTLGIPARVVVVTPYETSERQMLELHAGGARAIRFILAHTGGLPLDTLESFSARAKEMGWHLQFLLKSTDLIALESRLARLPSNIVIDHMGFVKPADGGLEQPAFQALLRLLEGGKCWVKFSGAYRQSVEQPPYPELFPFARKLVTEHADRILWGSDWPHVAFKGNMPNTTDLFDLLGDWAPNAATRKKILVDNPMALFDF